ncbi:uncharacterized protein LACBIDRAFT_322475 [Laccaria bicolor S238N-H82]|uniref:Predicted protein n=1 Tax=Laccaria bicolor (strain S238N-H82 / ATCC MYA-4686) TaxID=486041 RepID=B0CWF3_LACBS|nr:uncharacterized protein LACBIDRAFT_322475 [Laccaria bicolor S238N-H82]EDR13056.1 predicted protein [Laccaria bicolor S238N-H82]|eukprot:XP_001875554.1 predicted protein [Laccaria bicolor S238N-H82]
MSLWKALLILRNRAMGQHYNLVADKDFQIAPVLGKVKGGVKIYVSPLVPVELEFPTMQPSLKVPVTVNMNLGPVLKEVTVFLFMMLLMAFGWPTISMILWLKSMTPFYLTIQVTRWISSIYLSFCHTPLLRPFSLSLTFSINIWGYQNWWF